MKFYQPGSEVYSWDGKEPEVALGRTTHLGVCAHPDDLEILALHGILECFHQRARAFSGVVVTNGAGSARDAEYANYSDDEMRQVRRLEQKKAAHIGEYAAQIFLDHSSAEVKHPGAAPVVEDLRRVFELCRPEIVYTHSPCDRHDTHVAVALRTLEALRSLPHDLRPKSVIGCEVWGDLDWLPQGRKIQMDVSAHPSLQAALLGVFDSQIAGGKRYDLATAGRRRAHATFSESHAIDRSEGFIFGVDLMPLLSSETLSPMEFVHELTTEFAEEVSARVRRFVEPGSAL